MSGRTMNMIAAWIGFPRRPPVPAMARAPSTATLIARTRTGTSTVTPRAWTWCGHPTNWPNMTRDRSDGWFLGTRRVLVILDLRHRTSRALSCQLRASGNRLTTQSRTVVREGRGSSMLRRRLWFVVLAAALASSGVLLAPAASASSPDSLTARAEPALTVGTVLGGLQNPWDMAFTPAGSILFTERTGPIRFRIVGG